MKAFRIFAQTILLASLVLTACGGAQPTQITAPTNTPTTAPVVPSPTASSAPIPSGPAAVDTSNWSTTASTRTDLSFAFPGQWDGSSPLTFGEGEFVKDPDSATGVTFQIGLGGDPAALLADWGAKDIGIVGIVTFPPEVISDGENVVIARIEAPTKIVQGDGITAQVAYIQRPEDVMEVMWFAPTDNWENLQPTFQALLDGIEIWRGYSDAAIGLQTMYVHDWLEPTAPWEDTGVWFRSADEQTGVTLFVKNEIADPAQLLEAWSTDRLQLLGFTGCTLAEGDRMRTLGGEWESKTGECTNAAGVKVQYETTYVPDKDRLLEIIAYAPTETWEAANAVAFKHLLGMLIDVRP